MYTMNLVILIDPKRRPVHEYTEFFLSNCKKIDRFVTFVADESPFLVTPYIFLKVMLVKFIC